MALYDALLATTPGIKRKGATMPFTSVNGNMFGLLTADGTLALRLPASEREAFLKKYKTTLCEQYGAVMKEYVSVPRHAATEDTAAWEVSCTELPVRAFAQLLYQRRATTRVATKAGEVFRAEPEVAVGSEFEAQ